MEARKLTFDQAWNSITIFFVDDSLEDEIDREVDALVQQVRQAGLESGQVMSQDQLSVLLHTQEGSLRLILKEIGLSEEKFMRIVSVLRQMGRINPPLDREWNLDQIVRRLKEDASLASQIANLLLNGSGDPELRLWIPRYYLETLNLNAFLAMTEVARRARYKQSLVGTYSGRKGYRVEARVRAQLEEIRKKYGVGFEQGSTRLVNVNADFAVPTLDDPWVIVMCSFQETTSSGQSTKARDMGKAYTDVRTSNSRHKERRVFVNFADGGGWLARRSDFERLVNECDYFINLKHLAMLESIILSHVPRKYLSNV